MNLLRFVCLTVVAGCLAGTAANAQTVQPWPDILISGPVADGILLSGEMTGRIADDSRTSQLETRLQVGHALSKKVTAWVGWVHFENYIPNARRGYENQVVEQLNWNLGTVASVRISTRTRLEQRMVSGADHTSWRLRQQFRVVVPLVKGRGPSLAVWTEPFFALNKTSAQRRDLDQLRTFAGISVPVSRHLDIEAGYLNQRIYRAGPTLVNHAIPINLTLHY